MRRQWHGWRMRGALLRYQDGELPLAQARQIENHLASCDTCRKRLNVWKAAEQSLTRHTPRRNELITRDAQRLLAAVRMRVEAQTQNTQRLVRRRKIAALATACAFAGLWTAYPGTKLLEAKNEAATDVSVSASPRRNEKLANNISKPRSFPLQSLSPQVAIPAGTGRPENQQPPSVRRNYQHSAVTTTRMEIGSKQRTYRKRGRRKFEMLASRRARGNRSASGHSPVSVKSVEDTGNALVQAGEGTNNEPFAASESLSLLAQNMRGLPPDSHLLITVTDAAEKNVVTQPGGDTITGDNHAPSLPLKSRSLEAEPSGAATVSALQVDDAGTQVWRFCSVAQNKEGITTVRCATAWQIGRKPISSLAVMTETTQGDRK